MDKNSKEYRKYQRYLKSESWHRRKQRKLKQVGYKCEMCKSRHNLEAHHLHYNTLGKETNSDLQILCDICHPLADAKRRRNKAVETFGLKKYGTGWIAIKERVELEFDEWLRSKQ